MHANLHVTFLGVKGVVTSQTLRRLESQICIIKLMKNDTGHAY